MCAVLCQINANSFPNALSNVPIAIVDLIAAYFIVETVRALLSDQEVALPQIWWQGLHIDLRQADAHQDDQQYDRRHVRANMLHYRG
jgi:hypothetical protein